MVNPRHRLSTASIKNGRFREGAKPQRGFAKPGAVYFNRWRHSPFDLNSDGEFSVLDIDLPREMHD